MNQQRSQQTTQLQPGNQALAAAAGQAKHPISIRLDVDVLAWFKDQGEGYQTHINQVLRQYMTDQQPPD